MYAIHIQDRISSTIIAKESNMALKKYYLIPCLIVALAFFACTAAQASSGKKDNKEKVYVMGVVEKIDQAKKTFTLKKDQGDVVAIIVNPATDFEIDGGKGKHDIDTDFAGLKEGDWVKVKAYHPDTQSGAFIARDVDIYR